MKYLSGLLLFLLSFLQNYAQSSNISLTERLNTITTAVPFLLINPNAQAMGIGDIGVVASKNNYESGLTQNPALLSRGEKIVGGNFSYKPWIRHLVSDMYLLNVGGYHSLNKKMVVGGVFTYFSRGFFFNTDSLNTVLDSTRSKEFNVGLRFAKIISPSLSLGVGFNYIVSDLTGELIINGNETKIGRSLAFDFGLDYRKVFKQRGENSWRYDFGISINNIGNKISYIETSKDFIPAIFKVGIMLSHVKLFENDKKYSINLAYQAEKLLVPTPPKYYNDSLDNEGNQVIEYGMNPDVSVIRGMFQSFYDAPEGLKEELREILHCFGVENRLVLKSSLSFAVRIGFLNQHRLKGNRKNISIGAGVSFKDIYIDYSNILFYQHVDSYYQLITRKQTYFSNVTIGFRKMMK